MKRMVFCVITLFGFSLCTFPLANAFENRTIKRIQDLSHQSGKLGAYRALIIGINDSQDPKIPDRKAAVIDAEAVKKVLKEHHGFRDIAFLKNKQATKLAINQSVGEG